MGPQRTTSFLLQHVCSVMSKQVDQVLQEKLDMGLSQFKILRVLQHKPHTTQRQIAEWLGQTEASISRQIKIMIEKGLLRVAISPHNRREHLTTLTAKGLRLTDEAMQALADNQAGVYSSLGEKRSEQLLNILTHMHGYVCQDGKAGACHQPLKLYGKE